MTRVRLGIIGAGRIAQRSIAPAALNASNVEFVAAASRDIERAKSLGAKRAYDSYSALLDDPNLDMVFITTHNGLHCELAIEAMRKGKHVLCEKPLAPTVAECERMVAESKRSGRLLMEAFMYRYHPQIAALTGLVESGRLGEPTHLSASFHFDLTRADDVRLERAWGGGALLDVGCYCVNIGRLLLGEDIVGVSAHAAMHETKGVDVEGTAALRFRDGATAELTWGFRGPLRQRVELTGTRGSASINWAFAFRGEAQIMEVRADGSTEHVPFDNVDVYQLEIEDFAAAIVEGREPILSCEEGVKNVRVIERIVAAMR